MTDEEITTARAVIEAARTNRTLWTAEELARYVELSTSSPGGWSDALDEIQPLRAMVGVAA
jgi:hypothetical protein